MTAHARAIETMLEQLSLEEKVRFLTGQDSWSLYGLDSIGLRSMVVSDGPAGVRGDVWDERSPSVNFPSPTAIAASWNPELVREIGQGLGAEARRKKVDVVLAPTINIQRSPYGGRHFETFSEDAVLTARIATAYVKGIQDNGVGATLKHYVANDAETDRFTVSSDVDERTLREIYLAAFEGPVKEGPAWLVMSAYNSINGVTASEHHLLQDPLKDEWGFDGVVISDWTAVRSVEASALAAQDLAMPGPESPWAHGLLDAVRDGRVPESAVDEKVRRLLLLALRVGAIEGQPQPERIELAPVETAIATARKAAVEGSVLLANDGILPLSAPASIAVIGEGAVHARSQGGGSATVIPASVVSPLDGIRSRFGAADISWNRGAVVQSGLAEVPLDRLQDTKGEPGMRVRYLDGRGAVTDQEFRAASRIVSFDSEAKALKAATVEFSFTYTSDEAGDTAPFGVEGLSDYVVKVGGQVIDSGELRLNEGDDPSAVVLNPPYAEMDIPLVDGKAEVVVELSPIKGGMGDAIALGVGLPPARDDAETLLAEAEAAAKAAEVAIVVVSTSAEVESEGFDRTSLKLPGRQDELVARVLAANPRTVVIVNSGSPVTLPWEKDAAAVLATWFPGQEFGNALADVLSGDAEPGGRLPVSWPADEESVPVSKVVPTDGHLEYTEGIHVGYRAWLKKGVAPAFPFGHGLGYTEWAVEDLEVAAGADGGFDASVTVRNTGERAGKTVVQAYVSLEGSSDDVPARWLASFAPVRLEAGESTEVTLSIPERSLMRWSDEGWVPLTGRPVVSVGLSSDDLHVSSAAGEPALS
ncbi:beta-glucosidase [Demequina zhanjiangensis]|uniref:Glycoside hydrolase family 3 C-terminal domain-containing protein n=1 Tax=Demequina zhanjiangensis TaxID=3051659 RepID=A0ABT8G3V3_9MICO|nr:glycoside hydrolase family 3 C-terminal domain-containing protein [Demequina sp. SYSU T00b26]MDN4473819.1 glycoside hydrolase family 3 C-terminal domain-containing protein [Demequina sp. SYSU T00b26]